MKHLYSAFLALIILTFSSCSEHDDGQAHPSETVSPEVGDINDLEKGVSIDRSKLDELDFESLLSQDSDVVAIDVTGASDYTAELDNLEVNSESAPVGTIMSKELEAETALKNLEVHSIQRQKSIEDLRKINNKNPNWTLVETKSS